ncbi:hypothetical protein HanOQP8_Chr12g0458461 [Helianthus annuus]|nr:hypothetical protein HanIR_Chr12g0601251 [Helianthus annuus]KAJ0679354.1 hypothetical protein HanOQP8_Chr12g0458461 [Helianthus annuus]
MFQVSVRVHSLKIWFGFWIQESWVFRAQVRYGQVRDDLQPLSSGGYVVSSGSVESRLVSRFSFEYESASFNKSERSELFGFIFSCSGSTEVKVSQHETGKV